VVEGDLRNKRTVTLDLGKPEGQELLRQLAAEADVLVENVRPGVMDKWGLDPDQLLVTDPRLVVLRVTGFGQTGQEDGPPTLPPFDLTDGVAGISRATTRGVED